MRKFALDNKNYCATILLSISIKVSLVMSSSSSNGYNVERPLEELTLEELRSELANFRAMWSWLPENVKWHVARVGHDVRIQGRDYKVRQGQMGRTLFDVLSIDLHIIEEERDYIRGEIVAIEKVSTIPFNQIVQFDEILESEVLGPISQPESPNGKPAEELLPF